MLVPFFLLFLPLLRSQIIIQCNYSSMAFDSNTISAAFGSNWLIWANSVPGQNSSLISINISNIVYRNSTKINTIADEIQVQNQTLLNNTVFYVKSKETNEINLYKLSDLSLKYTFRNMQLKIRDSFFKSSVIYYTDGAALYYSVPPYYQNTYWVTFNSFTINNCLLINQQVFLNMFTSQNPNINYYSYYNPVQNQVSYFYNKNYVNFTKCNVSYYDPNTYLYVRLCPYLVQVTNMKTSKLQFYLQMPYNATNFYVRAAICNGMLIILTRAHVLYYQVSNWQFIQQYDMLLIPSSPFSIKGKIKCINSTKVCFTGLSNNTLYLYTIQASISSSVNTTGPINNTQTIQQLNTTINMTNLTQSAPVPMPMPTPTPAEGTGNGTATCCVGFVDQALNIIQHPQFNKTALIIYDTASVMGSTPIFRQFLQPLVFLVQQFWYYGYHTVEYTNFISSLSTKCDILTQIKLKPSFLSQLSIQIPFLSSKNNLYSSSSILPSGPSQQYMLYSIQDIYTFNLAQCVVMFVAMLGLKRVLKFVKAKCKNRIVRGLYRELWYKCIWWNFLVVVIEGNISPISYYAALQFNLFYGFQFWDKFNLIATVLIFYVVILYTYCFYRLVFRYSKPSESRNLLNIGVFSYLGFWLETVMVCHRRFNVAFFHGGLINNHFVQLIQLIILDLFLLYVTIKLRNQFRSKFALVMNFLYFLTFLFFDVSLFITTEIVFQDNLNQFRNNPAYNQYFIAIVLILCSITIMKIAYTFLMFVRKLFHKIALQSVDQNPSEQKNQQSAKFDLQSNYKYVLSKKKNNLKQDEKQNKQQVKFRTNLNNKNIIAIKMKKIHNDKIPQYRGAKSNITLTLSKIQNQNQALEKVSSKKSKHDLKINKNNQRVHRIRFQTSLNQQMY